jgi:hypothetical protein
MRFSRLKSSLSNAGASLVSGEAAEGPNIAQDANNEQVIVKTRPTCMALKTA